MPRSFLPQPILERLKSGGGHAPTSVQQSGVVKLCECDALEPGSAIPYYYQLLTCIESNIQRGIWRPGQKLPSERELCNHFRVSRVVVRQALNRLAASGLIETYRGKGSYVALPRSSLRQMASLVSFFEDAAAKGRHVRSQILDLSVVPARGEVAEALRLAEGSPVILLHRLRCIDDEPVLVSLTYLPEKLCPGLTRHDFTNQGLYGVLAQHYGLRLSEGSRTIQSVNAPPDLAELLRVPPGAALSLLKGIGFMADGTPLEFYMSWHRGDRCEFQVYLVNSQAGAPFEPPAQAFAEAP